MYRRHEKGVSCKKNCIRNLSSPDLKDTECPERGFGVRQAREIWSQWLKSKIFSLMVDYVESYVKMCLTSKC